MECLIYCRYSPKPNAKDDSLETQEALCREWARANGHDVVGVYHDRMTSGGMDETETDPLSVDRPALWDAMKALKKGQILLVLRMDRLGRDAYFTTFIERSVLARGADLVPVAEGSTLAGLTPEQKLMRQVLIAVAEYERKLIAKRLSEAAQRKMNDGIHVGGDTPYGWREVDGKLVPDPKEQAAIAKAMELRQLGHTHKQIAQIMEREGYVTRSGKVSRQWVTLVLGGRKFRTKPAAPVKVKRTRRPSIEWRKP